MAMDPGVERLDWSVMWLWVRVKCLGKAAEVTVGCIAQCFKILQMVILIAPYPLRLQPTNPRLKSSK